MAEQNWSENLTYGATAVHRPATVSELQDLVAAAPSVKALGTRHCFNAIADSPGGILVRTDGLDLGVTVDHEAMTATVPGGWNYSAVVAELERQGVALANLASLPHVSVAGATATATHGSGDTNQVLSAAISGLEWVAADGALRSADRSSPELPALAVGLGAFGVITQITLDVEPSFQVRQEMYSGTTWATVLDAFDEIMASAYSVNLHAAYADTDVRRIWQKIRLDVDDAGRPVDVEAPESRWGAARVTVADPDPGRLTVFTPAGPWSERLAHFTPSSAPSMGGDELQSEYFVARHHAVEALTALRAMGSRIDPHLHGTEIRTVAADELWLSPAYRRPSVCLGFTWRKHPAEVGALLPDIEAALAAFDVRPHWGKLFAMGPDVLAERFDRYGEFADLVRRHDPDGVFTNPYLERLRFA